MVNSNNPNMKLWSDLCITDPSKVKPITGKQYKGSSPQPYWLVRRATEQFGPCGQGWGIEIKAQGYQQLDAENIMHWATVIFWYMQDGVKCSTEHMGGTKAMYKTKSGLSYDEDAPKKSVTDAMVKAMSFLGFAGDIFPAFGMIANIVNMQLNITTKVISKVVKIKALKHTKTVSSQISRNLSLNAIRMPLNP